MSLRNEIKALDKLTSASSMAISVEDDGDDVISYKRWVKIFSPAKTQDELDKIDKAHKKLWPAKPKGKRMSPAWSAYIEAYNNVRNRIMKPIWANRDKEANKKIEIIAKQLSKNLSSTFGAKVKITGKRFTQYNWDEYSPKNKAYCVYARFIVSAEKTDETQKPSSVAKTKKVLTDTVKANGCLVKAVSSVLGSYSPIYRSKNQSLAVCSSILVALLVPCD